MRSLAMKAAVNPPTPLVGDLFPAHPPELVHEIVTVAHFDFKRVQELVGARPAPPLTWETVQLPSS